MTGSVPRRVVRLRSGDGPNTAGNQSLGGVAGPCRFRRTRPCPRVPGDVQIGWAMARRTCLSGTLKRDP